MLIKLELVIRCNFTGHKFKTLRIEFSLNLTSLFKKIWLLLNLFIYWYSVDYEYVDDKILKAVLFLGSLRCSLCILIAICCYSVILFYISFLCIFSIYVKVNDCVIYFINEIYVMNILCIQN
jgi:hypothetical protein